ncbi:MAG: RAD55 family ATPase [Halobacteria archaeon]
MNTHEYKHEYKQLKQDIYYKKANLEIKSSRRASTVKKSTGIEILDKNLGGGIPSGSIVYFTSDPKSMSEVFLFHFTTPRITYYFATDRRPKYIEEDIRRLDFDASNIRFIDIYKMYYEDAASLGLERENIDNYILEFLENELQSLYLNGEKDFTCIIDSFSFFLELNINFNRIKSTINLIYEVIKNTESICYLYILKGVHDQKIENLLLNISDVVFDIEIEKKGEKIANKLSIPKIRGTIPTTDFIKFKIAEGVIIDTSRDIA